MSIVRKLVFWLVVFVGTSCDNKCRDRGLTLMPPSDFIGVGETISLQATLTGCEGASGTISWSTSTPEFVTVDRSTGAITGVGAGTAKVQALADGVSSTVEVTVAPIQVVRRKPSLASSIPAALASRLSSYVSPLDLAPSNEGLVLPVGGPSSVMAVDSSGELLAAYHGDLSGALELSLQTTAVALVRFALTQPLVASEHEQMAWAAIETQPSFPALVQALQTAAAAGQGPMENAEVTVKAFAVVAEVTATLPMERNIKSTKLPVFVKETTTDALLISNNALVAFSASGPVAQDVLVDAKDFGFLTDPTETTVPGLPAGQTMSMTLGQNSASRLANVSAFMADIIDVGGKLTGVPVKFSDRKCTQGMLESVVTLPNIAAVSNSTSASEVVTKAAKLIVDKRESIAKGWLMKCASLKGRAVAIWFFKILFGWVSKIAEAMDLAASAARTRQLFQYWTITDQLTFCRNNGVLGQCEGPPDLEWSRWPAPPDARGTFDIRGDTVTDVVTGLTWQRSRSIAMKSWAAARSDCEALSLGGFDDWRLPTRVELVSLLDLGVVTGPLIDTTAFPIPNTTTANLEADTTFWTATEVLGLGKYYVVYMGTGSDRGESPGVPCFARCVR